ncbi:MAG: hypothetical protein J6M53_00345, partial [Bacteroidaceae bacterium]|nr:hypothetical protein [Bacteroidaceae bacterium]
MKHTATLLLALSASLGANAARPNSTDPDTARLAPLPEAVVTAAAKEHAPLRQNAVAGTSLDADALGL